MPDFLEKYQTRVNQALLTHLPDKNMPPTIFNQALHYATINGGKRVRAALVYLAGDAVEANPKALDCIAAAIECIHSYSLVHDDLPAMDDSPLRRGQPSCHMAYDEATAILIGDALQAHAFYLLSNPLIKTRLDPVKIIQIIQTLSYASGPFGMAAGQYLDITELPQVQSIEPLKKNSSIKNRGINLSQFRNGNISG